MVSVDVWDRRLPRTVPWYSEYQYTVPSSTEFYINNTAFGQPKVTDQMLYYILPNAILNITKYCIEYYDLLYTRSGARPRAVHVPSLNGYRSRYR